MDRDFWTVVIPRAAESYPVVLHSVIALAAYHESLETSDQETREFSVKQAGKRLRWLTKNHGKTPLAILQAHSFVNAAVSSLMTDSAYLQALKAQYTLVKDCGENEKDLLVLKDLFHRQLSKECSAMNPLPLLRHAALVDGDLPQAKLSTLPQAREALERLLNKAAIQRKWMARSTKWG